ncbi:MAG TPA: efflux RND transporter periplasmic adaptor subunit [Gammaproteobacteria bacterium]|nr:efflux RND transporter periplasmic adaptor subunit [Gammaproteobacteria bacterium]
MDKKIIKAIAAGVVLSLAISACTDAGGQKGVAPGKDAKPQGPMAMPVEAVAVETGAVTRDITAVGSMNANESVIIRSEIAGRIQTIHFSEGESVTQGAELITLDATEFRAQLAETTATVKLNELNFRRAQELQTKNLLSRQSYDEAQAKLAESRAQQNIEEARLAKTKLFAPFGGVLGLRQVSPGDYIKEGQDIVNLEDIASLKLDFRVPETYLAEIKLDQEVNLEVDAYPGRTFNGKVYAIDPRIDAQTRAVLLRAHIPNTDLLLRPGMFARVNLVLEQRTAALLVPEQALAPKGEEQFVYRIVAGKALQSKVKTGQRRNGKVEILEGLSSGDTVVTAGQTKLHDGTAVKVVSPADKNSAPKG